eukprot:3292752-Amphidinium_carterae.1
MSPKAVLSQGYLRHPLVQVAELQRSSDPWVLFVLGSCRALRWHGNVFGPFLLHKVFPGYSQALGAYPARRA